VQSLVQLGADVNSKDDYGRMVVNDIIDGFTSLFAMLISAAKSPLSRPDGLRWVRPESEGPGEWFMAYSRLTSLRVPLSSDGMGWARSPWQRSLRMILASR